MRLIPDQDQRDLAAMCRDVLTAECPTTLARALHSPDGVRITPGLWKALAEAGVLGLGIEEGLGGSGGELADLGVFCVKAGHALCPMIVHSTSARGVRRRLAGLGCGAQDLAATAGGGQHPGHHGAVEPSRRFGGYSSAACPRGREWLAAARRGRLRRRCRHRGRHRGERRNRLWDRGIRRRRRLAGGVGAATGHDGWPSRVHRQVRRCNG